MVSFEGPTSSECELVAGLEKKRKCRSLKAIEIYRDVFLLFYWLIGFISFAISIYVFVLNLPHSEVLPSLPSSCPNSPFQSRSLYSENFSFDLHALLQENETDVDQESELLWTKRGLTYGDLQSVHRFTTNVSIPEVSGTH